MFSCLVAKLPISFYISYDTLPCRPLFKTSKTLTLSVKTFLFFNYIKSILKNEIDISKPK